MSRTISRREVLCQSGVCLGAAMAVCSKVAGAEGSGRSEAEPLGYCLNMGTIMGQELSIVEEVEVAAGAGWQGVEPWIRNIQRYVDQGGSVSDFRKRTEDLGVTVVSAIGFARWAVDDDAERAKALEQFQREMDLVASIGGTRIAAPPAGINRTPGVDLRMVADRYRVVLELGRQQGVLPQLEIWGSAQTLGTAAEAAFVAVAADHPDACLLLDVFHLYKGGSGFDGLGLLNGAAMHAFHINDYPADPPREEINDSHRVYPGDGVAPMDHILQTLYKTGFRGMLCLELFNRDYWQQDAVRVAKTGLEKTRAAVKRALG